MGAVPNGQSGVTPGDYAVSSSGTAGMRGRTQGAVESELKAGVAGSPAWGGLGGGLLGMIGSLLSAGIGGLLGTITQGLTGVAGGVVDFIGHLLGMKSDIDTVSTEVINISGDQVQANTRLTKLEDVTGTGTITPIWSSVGGKDLVSFPKTMMQTHQYKDYDSGGENGGGGDTTRFSNSPAFVQGHGFVDVAFIRGGMDRKVEPKVVKIITGADTSWFDVSAWYLGLYVYNPANGYFSKIWDSGNIAGVLSSQRQAYNIGTGLTNTFIQPDHLIGVASLQIATGLGRRPRGLGCIHQTGISEAAGTTPFSPHAYFSGQSTLPSSFFRSNINYSKDKIMWAAVGESS